MLYNEHSEFSSSHVANRQYSRNINLFVQISYVRGLLCMYLFEEFAVVSVLTYLHSIELFSGLIEQGLMSHQTHYRSYRGRFLQVI